MIPGGLCPGRELSIEVDGVKGPSCSASIICLSHSPPLGACAPRCRGLRDLWGIKFINIEIIWVSEEEDKKKGKGGIFEESIVENYPTEERK